VQARPWSFIFWYKMENLKEDFFQISTGHDSWKEHLMTYGKEDCRFWMMLKFTSTIFMSYINH
jgi:hypothetical protein